MFLGLFENQTEDEKPAHCDTYLANVITTISTSHYSGSVKLSGHEISPINSHSQWLPK